MISLLYRLAFAVVMISLIVVADDPYASGFIAAALVATISIH